MGRGSYIGGSTIIYIRPESNKNKCKRKNSKKESKINLKNKPLERHTPSEYIYRAVDKGPDGAELVLDKSDEVLLVTTISSDDSWVRFVDLVLKLNLGVLKRITQVEGRMREYQERANTVIRAIDKSKTLPD